MKWIRVTKSRRCPICKSDHWCILSPDGAAAICMRVGSERSKRLQDGSIGYIHRLIDAPPPRREYASPSAAEINVDWPKILARYAMDTTPQMVAELAESLSVTADSLNRLGACWSKRHQAWAFPMWGLTDGFWEVCGIRLRGQELKWSIKGSHPGLFLPDFKSSGPIMVCEGPTDTAAMLSLGFDAIGRASCNGGIELTRALLAGRRQDVVIISDTDVPGRLGANRMALELRRSCKIIYPLAGKDARAWKQRGANRDVLLSVINNTSWVRPNVLRSQIQELISTLKQRMVASASKMPEAESTSPSTVESSTPAGSS